MSNRIIIISVILYFILAVLALIKYEKISFSGNEAAGNAIAKGLTFFYGLGILFLIAFFLTIINSFFYNKVTFFWIKILFFTPILFPICVLILMFFNVKLPYFKIKKINTKKEKEFEFYLKIRSKNELNNIGVVFSNKKKSTIYMLSKKETVGDINNSFNIYEHKHTINFKSNSSFYISADNYKTSDFNFNIPNHESNFSSSRRLVHDNIIIEYKCKPLID